MLLTLLLALMFIAAVFGALYAVVGLIQNKKLMTTAPKDIQEAAEDHPERFRGAHALGWTVAVICLLIMIGVFVYSGYDGIKDGFTFWQFFLRFILILYIWKAFDIICLDWMLLTKSHFFQHFYPETEGCAGYHQFGFNRQGQITRIIVFPFVAAAIAGICVMF